MKPLKNKAVEQVLEGRVIGYDDGHFYCDGCGNRINAFEHLREEGEPLELTAFCIAPQGRHDQWKFNLVYCPECDEREIGTPTQGVDEAMVEFKLTKGETSPEATEIQVVDRSKP